MTAIYPVDDTRDHLIDDPNCPCGPKYEMDIDGEVLLLHRAFDGRELLESVSQAVATQDHTWKIVLN